MTTFLPEASLWQVLVAGAIGFLLGSLNPARALAALRGVDILSVGSGNPGATNIGRTLGKRSGLLVAVLDIAKGFVPVVVFDALWGTPAGEVAGFAAVLGHIFSPFLGFRGGKGVATTLGAVLGVQPVWLLAVLPVFLVTVLITRKVGLGAVAGSVALIGCGLFWSTHLGDSLFAICLGLLVLIRHEKNIAAALDRHDHDPLS